MMEYVRAMLRYGWLPEQIPYHLDAVSRCLCACCVLGAAPALNTHAARISALHFPVLAGCATYAWSACTHINTSCVSIANRTITAP